MAMQQGATDTQNTVLIEPAITRAYWSTCRAWHGADVKICIETRNIPDDTKVKVKIWEDDGGEGGEDDFIAEVKGSHTIKKNRCVISYKIAFDEGSLGEPLALEGGALEFYFKARIDDFDIEARSSLLYVDLEAMMR